LRLYVAETVFGPGNIGSGGESSRQVMRRKNGRRVLEQFDMSPTRAAANVAT